MSDPLFYFPEIPAVGSTLHLTGDEARHAAGARRLTTGENLWLFDGRGTIACATLAHITGRGNELELRVLERRTEPPSKPIIHLACALPKGDRTAVLFDMATQLGMTQFTPLACERSVVKPSAANRERWQRICLEACKQSRRLYLPAIDPPATPAELAARAAASSQALWLAHPSGGAIPAFATKDSAHDVTILIGPEGGFTGKEIEQLRAAGAKTIGLGQAILRIETAAVAVLAAINLSRGA